MKNLFLLILSITFILSCERPDRLKTLYRKTPVQDGSMQNDRDNNEEILLPDIDSESENEDGEYEIEDSVTEVEDLIIKEEEVANPPTKEETKEPKKDNDSSDTPDSVEPDVVPPPKEPVKEEEPKPKLPLPLPLWEKQIGEGPLWTKALWKVLDIEGKDLLSVIPADKNLFCPNYAKLSLDQRKAYWIFMLSAMAQFESSFRPQATHHEPFLDGKANNVISRGLLQISFESGKAYQCHVDSEQDLHDPVKNLTCGVRILNRWVFRDGRIAGKVVRWRGGARYWSVLRAANKKSYLSILKWSQNLSICKIN